MRVLLEDDDHGDRRTRREVCAEAGVPKEAYVNRRVACQGVLTMTLMMVVPVSAHPGHEYRVKGTVTKVRRDVFEVDDDGGKTVFFIVAGTEFFVGDRRAAAADVKVGLSVEVEGVENDRGMIEAKLVRLSAS